jgi:hypothetical protein
MSEKVYIVAGPEFGDREGDILIISKALYGLCSSGARWHDQFADCINSDSSHGKQNPTSGFGRRITNTSTLPYMWMT